MLGVGRVGWVVIGAVLALTACGGSSERRNEDGDDPIAGAEGDDDGPTQGGGSGVGGTTGGSGIGGTAGTSGVATCERPLPDAAEIGCDYLAALGAPGVTGYCSRGGCHNTSVKAGGLDLAPDLLLASRLLDVPAKHQINCGANPCDPVQATCQQCSACPNGALLIDTADPTSSWILRTMEPFIPGTTTSTITIGCGDAMPSFNTTGIAGYTQAHKDCLTAFFLALARTPGDWPCTH